MPGSTLRRPADDGMPSRPTSRHTSLRIVMTGVPVVVPHPASVARVVRHGPPDAIIGRPRDRHPSIEAIFVRARALWPGLDARALARTQGDVRRIARLVGRRTALPEETIIAMLTAAR